MNLQSMPAAARAYIEALLIERLQPLLFSFDAGWQLLAAHGDPSEHGFASTTQLAEELADLFVGLSTECSLRLPFVELSNGRSAHVHLIPDGAVFHVLLLDTEEERIHRRDMQLRTNEATLAGHAKSRAIDQLKDIRGELERQRGRLEEANAFKAAMITTLSHEFRTPLTSVFGYLHLLEGHCEGSTEAAHALDAIRRNSTHLFALAENLLHYARGEANLTPENLVEVDLRRLAADFEAMFRPLAEAKGLGFAVEAECAVDDGTPVFDLMRLRQIAINLLSNALRYTERGEVGAVLRWREGRLLLEVRDTGVGIAETLRERIFEPFDRGGRRDGGGAGLGLSIVRSLVRGMGGRVRLESQPGVGSRFEVELPGRGVAGAPPAAEREGEPCVCAGRTALVVDDDSDIALLIASLLGRHGLRVRIARDAAEALEQIAREAPDLLLIDVQLPGLSGNAAVLQLRARGYRGRIVTMSAAATLPARDAALRAGADRFLNKPLDIGTFTAVVCDVLSETPKPPSPDAGAA